MVNHKITFTIVLISLIGSGCGGGSGQSTEANSVQAISVNGQASFSDGTPVTNRSMQLQFVLDGANMFPLNNSGCTQQTPAHVAGTVIEQSSASPTGGYTLSTSIHSLYAAVVRSCLIQNLNSDQIEGLTIKASILADATTCPVYCSAQGDPSQDCVIQCSTGNRTLGAQQTLTAQQVLAADSSNGTIQWSGPLVFNSLGPVLDVGSGPVLAVDAGAAQTSAHVTQEGFAPGACEVEQQCIRAPGNRTLLRFDGTIDNLGDEDLVIGSPTDNSLFTQDSCHHVPLLKDIMLYELIDPSTGKVVQVDDQDVIGRKEGFCMMDISQVNATAPQGKYDCNNQGITAGWADVYDADLDCQFLDITGVPAGNYNLRLTVNPEGLFPQSDSSNAVAEFPVTIPGT
jgi:hypothetical protein